MQQLLVAWIANTLAILAVGWGLGLMTVESTASALAAGAVLGIVNTIIRPILVILTLPFTLASLGLFYFVVTGFCLWLTAKVVPGFEVHGVWRAVFASI